MPLYEFECPEHGVFEELFQHPVGAAQSDCPECGQESGRVCSVPVMRPDSYWAGHYSLTLGRHFTSKSEEKRFLKERRIEDGGGVADNAASRKAGIARQERDAAAERERERSIAATVNELMT